jgi:SP family arabinose:H+ symporter-like MFS transporter
LVGSVGCAASLAGAAVIFFSNAHENLLVWMLIGFIASFSFSQGAVIWVYLSEVFPTRVRAQGQSLGSFTHWAMNALISLLFPVVAAKSRGLPFVFFSIMMVLQFVVVFAVYPETKGVTLEDMQKKLGIA